MCGRVFSDRPTLRRHVRSVHLREKFTCTLCEGEGRTFNRRDHYRAHQRKAHGNLQCEECELRFIDGRTLRMHWLQEHRPPPAAAAGGGGEGH